MLNTKKIFSVLIYTTIIVAMILLIISIIKSVYYYQYDNDEFYHVQRAYLIATGLNPYISFQFGFTALFHIILLPILKYFGATFATLGKIRIFMVLLFAVRVVLSALLINRVFNRRVALLFIPLLLFDPFTIFSSMQIRPDNFMMVAYTLGLLIFATGLLKSSRSLLFFAGVVFGVSFLILIKITLQLAVLIVIYGIYCALKGKLKDFISVINGFVLALFLFCLYYLFNGSLFPMFDQVFVKMFSLPGLIDNKVYYGFFHQPDNGFIYGLMGKPLTWYYVWILPLLASAGVYLTLSDSINNQVKSKNIDQKKQLIYIILIVGFIVQFLFLLNLNTVFIQYYIPFQWYLAMFAAVLLDNLIYNKFTSGFIHKSMLSICFILFIAMVYVSYKANIARTFFNSKYQLPAFARIWSKVPPNAAIFPSVLFRPIAYPLSVGEVQLFYNNEVSAAQKDLPSHIESFEKNKPPYLLIDNPDNFYILEPGLDKYVRDHYRLVDDKIKLYQRIK